MKVSWEEFQKLLKLFCDKKKLQQKFATFHNLLSYLHKLLFCVFFSLITELNSDSDVTGQHSFPL